MHAGGTRKSPLTYFQRRLRGRRSIEPPAAAGPLTILGAVTPRRAMDSRVTARMGALIMNICKRERPGSSPTCLILAAQTVSTRKYVTSFRVCSLFRLLKKKNLYNSDLL